MTIKRALEIVILEARMTRNWNGSSVVILFLVFFCCTSITYAQGNWMSEAPISTARFGAATGVINGKLYVAGGCCVTFGFPFTRFSVLEVYDPATNTWTTKAPIPHAVYSAAAGVIDGKLYVAGGQADPTNGNNVTDLQIYDPATDSWSNGRPLPAGRAGANAGVINGKLYVAGGTTPENIGEVDTALVYDPATDTWTNIAPMINPRASAGTAVMNGILYLVGGLAEFNPFTGIPVNTVDSYNPATDTWTTLAPMPTTRYILAAGVINGKLYAAGGTDNANTLTTVESYDPVANTWTTTPSMLTAAYGPNAGVINNTLILAGGNTLQNQLISVVQAFATSSPLTCQPGTTILNVGLPAVAVPVQSAIKKAAGFRVVYNALGLNFTVLAPSGRAICTAQSNTGTLNVSIHIAGVSVLQAQSTASATLDIFPSSSVGPLLTCDFASGITNGCILNDAFDPNANYIRWSTAGFITKVFGGCGPTAICKAISTGPLVFWVDADALGLSPNMNSMDAIVRGVEPFIHTELIKNLPFVAPYAKIQDPGAVKLLIVNSDGMTTGILPSGTSTNDMPGTIYVPSDTNPAVTLATFEEGNYEVILTGVSSGSYQLDALVTNFMAPSSEAAFDNTIAQGQVVAYTLHLSNTAAGPVISNMTPAVFVPGDLNGDGKVDCFDLMIAATSYGAATGQVGFNAWADLDDDGIINIPDLEFIVQRFPQGLTCPNLKILSQYVTFQSTLKDINDSLQLGLIDNHGVANSLSSKIQAAQAQTGNARNNILNAFINEVNAQAGKHITVVTVQVLLADASALSVH
jgi:N-acetylneuraminic acid mutarotase